MFKFEQDPFNIKDFMAQNVIFCLPEGYSRKFETILVPVSNFYIQEINFYFKRFLPNLVCIPKFLGRVRRGRLLLVPVLPGLTSTVFRLPCVCHLKLFISRQAVFYFN